MKETKIKLSLNKETVSHLNSLEMNRLNGGAILTAIVGDGFSPVQPVCVHNTEDGCVVSEGCAPETDGCDPNATRVHGCPIKL